ncbi:hypothetical protein STENM36S_06238 [Streptomyces tendae]
MRIPAHSVCTAIRDDIVTGVHGRREPAHRGTPRRAATASRPPTPLPRSTRAARWRPMSSSGCCSPARSRSGTGRTPGGVGRSILDNIRDAGYTGRLYAVNRAFPQDQKQLDGVPACRSVRDIEGPVDLAVVTVPAEHVPDVVTECGEHGVQGLVVISAGYADSGPDGRERQRALVRQARTYGMRIIGPNAFGIINTSPQVRLNASLAPEMPRTGRIGLFAQSGAIGIALLSRLHRRGGGVTGVTGVSTFVSSGNRADVSGNDVLQYWYDDPDTDVALMYLESIGNPRKFTRLARRTAAAKPLVVVQGARHGGVAPQGHAVRATRLPHATVSALLRQAGVIRVDTITDLVDAGLLLARQPLPAGPRVAILGNSESLGLLTYDACLSEGLRPQPAGPDHRRVGRRLPRGPGQGPGRRHVRRGRGHRHPDGGGGRGRGRRAGGGAALGGGRGPHQAGPRGPRRAGRPGGGPVRGGEYRATGSRRPRGGGPARRPGPAAVRRPGPGRSPPHPRLSRRRARRPRPRRGRRLRPVAARRRRSRQGPGVRGHRREGRRPADSGVPRTRSGAHPRPPGDLRAAGQVRRPRPPRPARPHPGRRRGRRADHRLPRGPQGHRPAPASPRGPGRRTSRPRRRGATATGLRRIDRAVRGARGAAPGGAGHGPARRRHRRTGGHRPGGRLGALLRPRRRRHPAARRHGAPADPGHRPGRHLAHPLHPHGAPPLRLARFRPRRRRRPGGAAAAGLPAGRRPPGGRRGHPGTGGGRSARPERPRRLRPASHPLPPATTWARGPCRRTDPPAPAVPARPVPGQLGAGTAGASPAVSGSP